MEMAAERLIAAPRNEVWRCLNDPEILKACIPGCESIEATGPDSYKVAMVAAVGFIKAKFVGDLTLQNKVDNTSYDLSFNGSGGAAGFGKGTASVSLSDAPGGTTLTYRVKAQVGGKLAQVGARVIDGVAKKMADDFFQRLDQVITTSGAGAAKAPTGANEPPRAEGAQRAPADGPSPGGANAASSAPASSASSRLWLYVAAAIAAVIVAAFALGGGTT